MKVYCCFFVVMLSCVSWSQEAAQSPAGQNYEEGLVHMMAGETAAALLSFEAALKERPDYVEAILAVGDLHLQTGDYDQAWRAYERALQIQPHAPGAHVGLGHVVWQTEQDARLALDFYQKALHFDPEHAEANCFAGKMLAAQNQPETAIPVLEKAIRLAPHAYEPHLSLGLCYESQGNYDFAKAHWQAAKNKSAFPYVLLEWGRNLLATVSENGILFTAGEQETYLLWYLQKCQDLRPDLNIVNLNLLQEIWYIQMLRDRPPAVHIEFDDGYLNESLRGRFMPAPERMEVAGLQWILAPPAESQFLRVQDLMLLKIIEWNDWQRPIYFALTVEPSDQLGLQEYLSMEGLAWRLCRSKTESLQAEKTWENVRQNYAYEHVKELAPAGNSPALLMNYAKIFCLLAETFHKRRAFAQCKAVLAWGDSLAIFKDAASNDWAARLSNSMGEKMSAAKFQAQAQALRRRK